MKNYFKKIVAIGTMIIANGINVLAADYRPEDIKNGDGDQAAALVEKADSLTNAGYVLLQHIGLACGVLMFMVAGICYMVRNDMAKKTENKDKVFSVLTGIIYFSSAIAIVSLLYEIFSNL